MTAAHAKRSPKVINVGTDIVMDFDEVSLWLCLDTELDVPEQDDEPFGEHTCSVANMPPAGGAWRLCRTLSNGRVAFPYPKGMIATE